MSIYAVADEIFQSGPQSCIDQHPRGHAASMAKNTNSEPTLARQFYCHATSVAKREK